LLFAQTTGSRWTVDEPPIVNNAIKFEALSALRVVGELNCTGLAIRFGAWETVRMSKTQPKLYRSESPPDGFAQDCGWTSLFTQVVL